LWATAVETAQLFTGQALKSKVKNASEDWLRFFSLTSSAFALRERCATVPGTPATKQEIAYELADMIHRTDIMGNLSSWNDTIHILDDKDQPQAHFYLLILDTEKRTLHVERFEKFRASEAQTEYDKAEKNSERSPSVQVVLVSVDDLDALRKAYPNYYVDTRGFISAVQREMKELQPR
jgi:hypothetical protein